MEYEAYKVRGYGFGLKKEITGVLGRYPTLEEAQKVAAGEKEDEFYLRVKNMLLSEGEVSDAIGRLTDKEYFSTLSYEERQRYTLSLSEKYLRALERFRRESEFALSSTENAR